MPCIGRERLLPSRWPECTLTLRGRWRNTPPRSSHAKHNYADLQVLLAGGLTPHVGHLHYPGCRPLADLWLTLVKTAGVSIERFADSTGTLKELT